VCDDADDHSRVKLERSSLDYINASLVIASEAERSYILTQVRRTRSVPALLCTTLYEAAGFNHSNTLLLKSRVVVSRRGLRKPLMRPKILAEKNFSARFFPAEIVSLAQLGNENP